MAIRELESFDSGSNYSFGEKLISPNFSRSGFNLTHLVTGTYDNAGIVYPLGWVETLPTDDFDIDVKALVRVLPQVVPLYSRQRLYIYAFWSRLSDLWQNFNTFMTGGYNGRKLTHNKIPTLNTKNCVSGPVQVGSFGQYMGLPLGYDWSETNASEVTALPFMACLRVMRDYFCNRNYYIDDRVLLPDDDTRFRLNDDGELLSAKDANKEFKFDIASFTRDATSGSQICKGYYVDSNGKYRFEMFTHDYPSDRFTSSLPFPQRGDTPTLNMTITSTATLPKNSLDGKLNAHIVAPVFMENVGTTVNAEVGVAHLFNSTTGDRYNPLLARTALHGDTSLVGPFDSTATMTGYMPLSLTDTSGPSSNITLPITSIASSITLNQLRELSIAQTELEKMARTDGSYAQFGITFFGEKSKNAEDFRPVYIGGTYTNIQFTEVLQTSTQYADGQPVGSPLGTYGGHGIGSVDNGSYIGHVHCDDYGIITLFACLMPDVYYSQGLAKKWTRLLQSDYMLPERAKLGLIPVLNEELFYSPDDSGASSELKNKYLWAWNNIFDEYRYAPNRITGSMADPTSENFSPYTQSRIFSELVPYGHSFSQASNIRKDYLAAPSEYAYTAQFRLGITAVRPLPYKPVPASILN